MPGRFEDLSRTLPRAPGTLEACSAFGFSAPVRQLRARVICSGARFALARAIDYTETNPAMCDSFRSIREVTPPLDEGANWSAPQSVHPTIAGKLSHAISHAVSALSPTLHQMSGPVTKRFARRGSPWRAATRDAGRPLAAPPLGNLTSLPDPA